MQAITRIGLLFFFICCLTTGSFAEDSALLSTNDGLTMVLEASTGRLTHLKIDGIESASAVSPLVEVETVDTARPGSNLINNGDFDSDTNGWSTTSPALTAIDTSTHHNGAACLKITHDSAEAPGVYVFQDVVLNQKVTQPVILSGWSKAILNCPQNLNGIVNSGFAILVSLKYIDGQEEGRCQQAYFPQYSHDWTQAKAIICPDKPLASVRIIISVASDKICTLWVDNLELRQARFVNQTVTAPLKKINGGWLQQCKLAGGNLSADVKYLPKGDHIEIKGEIGNISGKDQAATVRISLPVDARGGKWWRHQRSSVDVADGQVYWDSFWYGAGRTGNHSMYPWSVVDLPNGKSLSLGVDIGEPQIFRLLYNGYSQEYDAEFDIGMTSDKKRTGKGVFSAVIYRTDRKWAFRDATRRYQAIYPWAFVKRVSKDGIWNAFHAAKSAVGWQDFGIQINESAQDFAWESAQGIYTLMYIEPGCTHSYMYIRDGDERTPPAAIQRAKDVLSGKRALNPDWYPSDPWTYDTMEAVLSNYMTDAWGNPTVVEFAAEDAFPLNTAPGVPPVSGYKHNAASIDYKCVKTGLDLDGQYHLDSWEPLSDNYVRSYWIDSKEPRSGRQCIKMTSEPHYAHWSPWARGVKQYLTLSKPYSGEVKLEFWARGTANVSAKVTICHQDGTREYCTVLADSLVGTWRRFQGSYTTKSPFVHFGLDVSLPGFTGEVYVDDVRFGPANNTDNWLIDSSFEHGSWLKGKISGVYLDTLECSQGFLNYRREHFPYLQTNLTFDWARRVTQPQIFGQLEFAREISKRLHKDNKLLMANACPLWTPFLIPYVDIGGQEEEWVPGGTGWSPKSDESMSWCRAMTGTKPYCILLSSRGNTDKLQKQIARCTFYGVWPSFATLYTGDEAKLESVYIWNMAVLEQDRPIWRKYIPVLKRITSAGWQMMTYAVSNNPDVWVERFGNADTKGLYMTLYNPTSSIQNTHITIDRARLGLSANLSIAPVLNTSISETLNTGTSDFSIQVPPEDTVVVLIASNR